MNSCVCSLDACPVAIFHVGVVQIPVLNHGHKVMPTQLMPQAGDVLTAVIQVMEPVREGWRLKLHLSSHGLMVTHHLAVSLSMTWVWAPQWEVCRRAYLPVFRVHAHLLGHACKPEV